MKKLLIVALLAAAVCSTGMEARTKYYRSEVSCTDGNCGSCKGKRCKSCPSCPRRKCGRGGCKATCTSGTCTQGEVRPDYVEDVRSGELEIRE